VPKGNTVIKGVIDLTK